jgi:hypothetical protein
LCLKSNGYLKYPVASCDSAIAAVKHLTASDLAREEHFDEDGCGYALVQLCQQGDANANVFCSDPQARSDWDKFREDAEQGINGSHLNYGQPLFLDHYDEDMENRRHLGRLGSLKRQRTGDGRNVLLCGHLAGDPTILIDESGMRFDYARWGAQADTHSGLSAAAAVVHSLVVDKMPPQFQNDDEYRQSKTYKADYASALATMEHALRQNSHVDTYKEGFSVLVAVDSDFRLVVFENSLQLIRRVIQLWEIFKAGHKMSPGGVGEDEWWDYCCWRQLQKEGWGTDRRLEPVTLVIPKGHALIFSSWLLHAGAEWQVGDVTGYNRMHFYFTKHPIESMKSVFMQDRMGVKSDTSFSPCLHFLPQPEEPGSEAVVLKQWVLANVEETLATLRPKKPRG